MPGKDRPFQCRYHRVAEPDDPREQVGARAETLHQVVSKLFLDGAVGPPGILEVAEGERLLGLRRVHAVTVGADRR